MNLSLHHVQHFSQVLTLFCCSLVCLTPAQSCFHQLDPRYFPNATIFDRVFNVSRPSSKASNLRWTYGWPLYPQVILRMSTGCLQDVNVNHQITLDLWMAPQCLLPWQFRPCAGVKCGDVANSQCFRTGREKDWEDVTRIIFNIIESY